MRCPRCDEALTEGRAGDLHANGCSRCGGLWLNNADSQRVVGGLSAKALDVVRALSEEAEHSADTGVGGLRCPLCEGGLERQQVAQAWLEVDICQEHGTWFDAGEVERIAAAMKNPVPADWRARTVPAGPKPNPVKRTTDDEVEHMDMRSPYLRGFENILRSLWKTFTDSSQYTSEADIDIEIAGRRFTVTVHTDGPDTGFGD
jgi:Zn-finger nucleic acid-binding protein